MIQGILQGVLPKYSFDEISAAEFDFEHSFTIFVLFIWFHQAIHLMSRVFANGPGDWSSIPCRVIQKTQKMVLDAALLNSPRYKLRIKGILEQSREWSSAFPHTLV